MWLLQSWAFLAVAACTAWGKLPGARLGVSTQGLEVAVAFWVPHELPKLNTVVIPGHVAHKGDKFDYADIHLTSLWVEAV